MPVQPNELLIKLGRLNPANATATMVYWGVDGQPVKINEVVTLPASQIDPLLSSGWFRVGCYLCAARQFADLKKSWAVSIDRLTNYPTELRHALTRHHPSNSIVNG